MSWNFPDPHPTLRLVDIESPLGRAKSWLARASRDMPFGFEMGVRVGGVLPMLDGLEHHYLNFVEHESRLEEHFSRIRKATTGRLNGVEVSLEQFKQTDRESAAWRALAHEAVAYINRLGQFLAFAKDQSSSLLMPRGNSLMLFRNKHTAHRSIDAPRGETQHLKEVHAMAFSFGQLVQGDRVLFQIQDENNRVVEFRMHEDHHVVLCEALEVLQAIHQVQ